MRQSVEIETKAVSGAFSLAWKRLHFDWTALCSLLFALTFAAPLTVAAAPKSVHEVSVAQLKSLDTVKEICLATRPVERVHFSEDAEGSRAKEAYQAELARLERQLFKVSVPVAPGQLGTYSNQASELPLRPGPLSLLHGAVRVTFPASESASFSLNRQQAQNIAELAQKGELELEYFFLLSTEAGAVCQGSLATQIYSLSTTPVAFLLRNQVGDVLVRDESSLADAHREALGGFTGVPRVLLGAVSAEREVSASEVATRLDALIAPVRSCYEDRVHDRPGVAGTVVLGVGVGAAGEVQTVDVIADALHDEALLRCLISEMRQIRFVGLAGLPSLFRVPVEFRRVSARGSSGAGRTR